MRLLRDTHALIWWLAVDEALSRLAHQAIANEVNEVTASARLGHGDQHQVPHWQASHAALLARDFEAIVAGQGVTEMAITVRHARLADEMNIAHKDPFDRLLIAQAQAEGMVLVSNEILFDTFAVPRIW